MPEPQPAHGLDRIEKILFFFGVFGFAFLMLAFGGGSEISPVPVAVVWIVAGLGFVFWFDRHLKQRRE